MKARLPNDPETRARDNGSRGQEQPTMTYDQDFWNYNDSKPEPDPEYDDYLEVVAQHEHETAATTAAEDVRLIEAALDMAVSESHSLNFDQREFASGKRNQADPVIIEGREAFARYRDHMAALMAFVADVRDSKARATSDEECVMAFVRLGNEAGRLLEEIGSQP